MMKGQRRDLKSMETGFVKVSTLFYIFSDKNRGAKLFILLLLLLLLLFSHKHLALLVPLKVFVLLLVSLILVSF